MRRRGKDQARTWVVWSTGGFINGCKTLPKTALFGFIVKLGHAHPLGSRCLCFAILLHAL